MSDERRRIREAMIDIALDPGYEAASAEMLAARAGMTPDELSRHFASLEDCYLEVYEENTAAFDAIVIGAFEGAGPWRDRLRAAAYAAARFIRDHPREIRFGVTAMFRAGALAQVHRERQLHRMVDLIDEGRQELENPESLSRSTAEAAVGSIYTLLTKQLGASDATGSAEAFVPQLMYIAVRPYLGEEAAREELSIPPPPGSGGE